MPAQGGESQRRKRRALGLQSNARPRDSSSRLMSGARPGGSAGASRTLLQPLHCTVLPISCLRGSGHVSDGIFPYTQYSSVLYRKEWPLAVNTIIVVHARICLICRRFCVKEGRKEGSWKCTKRPWNETLSRMTPLFHQQHVPIKTLLFQLPPIKIQQNSSTFTLFYYSTVKTTQG